MKSFPSLYFLSHSVLFPVRFCSLDGRFFVNQEAMAGDAGKGSENERDEEEREGNGELVERKRGIEASSCLDGHLQFDA